MAQKVIAVPTGRFDGRNYLLVCEESRKAALIDADIESERLLSALQTEGAELKYILLTHGHFDHFASADLLREKTGAQIAIHKLDVSALADPSINMSAQLDKEPITLGTPDINLEEGSVIALGKLEIKVLHTPGHTVGSCCFLCEASLFSGDTIFRGTYGNTAFSGGNMGELIKSAARILSLDESLDVYPGHGMPTTIARERAHNPIRL